MTPQDDPSRRIVVMGNCGSGKSSLALRLGAALTLPVQDLDLFHWHPDGRKRDEAEAKSLTAGHAAAGGFIIEGVYGWLIEAALERAGVLIWLDLAWEECLEGLQRRGAQHNETESGRQALLTWAADYWTRTTSSSFAGHGRLYEAFGGAKLRLRTRAAASALSPQSVESLTAG